MSFLIGVFKEELDRLEQEKVVFEEQLQLLPKGYISKKKIAGKEYCYLQRREGGKVISQYIAAGDLPKIEVQIKRRKRLEESLRRIREDQKKLRKVLS